jgi:hypothetical protein
LCTKGTNLKIKNAKMLQGIKKMSQYTTFLDGRKCRTCNKPIADQEHAAREFCEVTYDENGKVKDCKTAFHRMTDADNREKYRQIINTQKFIKEQLDLLISKKGNEVLTEDLNAYDILLSLSISHEISISGVMTSHFLKHTIITNPITKKHKIQAHE